MQICKEEGVAARHCSHEGKAESQLLCCLFFVSSSSSYKLVGLDKDQEAAPLQMHDSGRAYISVFTLPA